MRQGNSTGTKASHRARRLGIVAMAVVMALTACGDDDDDETTSAGQSGQSPTTAGAVATTALATTTTAAKAHVATALNPTFGTILVDSSGRTLYTFDRDTPGTSACTGNCAQTWPPLMLPAGATTPVAGTGVSSLTAIARPDGGTQIAIADKPLYLYAADTQPGDVKGDGVGGVWHVAKGGPGYSD